MSDAPGGLGRRLRYLARRAASLNPANVWRIAGAAAPLTRKPRLLIVADMLWCAVRYEFAFQDYLDWDVVMLTAAERRTFITHPKSNHLAMTLNDPQLRRIFADKLQFNARFAEFIGRDWIELRASDADAVRAFLDRHGRAMLKVPDSLSGFGIEKVEASEVVDVEAFRTRAIERRQFLLEGYIVQHPEMAALCPTSVNSLRVITFFDGSELKVLASVLKIGNGGDIDNFSGGGMYTMLDDTGTAHFAAFDGTGATYAVHPLSGVSIVGFTVPLYAEVLTLLDRAARVIPEVPYVGWDVAITATGPVIIEGNPNSGVYQSKPSVSGIREGLLPRYRAAIGF
ncbi:sugar-transfer associated ATP-grasp domain-containing protein [Protaetiibacter larvae]|uniref:Alpha-L-glutamate ligase-related protein ATP-grasp domain-containing protein n=1 Tax=Protaetiibacter larvae TaxID=2592654 RepID=A0A5C1YBE8_9MICO|nr:sugar-transfer associated ATP-grasp domain-containing protein [Protaetiibacter larvae]QEO10187.1 hypothetical protein FLP23_09305 [Protaetiibacter larvae]